MESNSPETMARNRELDKILEFSTDIICTIDEYGTFLRISASVYQILGYTAAELVGTSYKKIIDPRDFETSTRIGAKIKNGFVLSGFENHYIHKSGKIIHIILSDSFDIL